MTAALECIAICTRDRPESFTETLASIALHAPCLRRLIVVDQSAGDSTEHAVAAASACAASISYLRQSAKGLSRARNAALAMSGEDDILVFTDDDCLIREGWLEEMVRPFMEDETVGIAFGNVLPIPIAPEAGFIVGYESGERRALKGRLGKLKDGGIGASMAVRVSAARSIGGFDEMLGAGGRFPSCEDGDFAYRMLKGGYRLFHVPGAVVDHTGLREWSGASKLVTSTYYAVGAAYAKHLRCGDLAASLLLGQQLGFCVGEVGKNVVRRRRPLGLRRITSLVNGAAHGFFSPVDRKTARFAIRPS